jgi:NADPH-dependent 2,4-dienoyl-CoA reductase/sulfur reductase-like enzyme/rhodanese-related sulfurtransferase
MKKDSRILIIGGIAAGTSAAAKIRRNDEHSDIVLYEKDKYISYATCGLPYFISGKIEEKKRLLVNTVPKFEKRFNVSVKVNHEVLSIDPSKKEVIVKDLEKGQKFTDRYDKLLICTGSDVVKLKNTCIDEKRIFYLKTLDDALRIKGHIASLDREKRKAIIIGGGYIGLELLEGLLGHGFEVTVIEKLDQILNHFDQEISEYVRHYLADKGVRIMTGMELSDITIEGGLVKCSSQGHGILEADMVFIGVGVRPEVSLAKSAGISTGASGGIKTDRNLTTNNEDIFAAGDCVECENSISGEKKLYYLANIASRQGRTAAINICGQEKDFTGVLPSSIIKVLDLTVSKTGLSMKECKKLGMDYDIIEGHFPSHASYYPGSQTIHMILIYGKQDGSILGFEAVGRDGVDKKTDIIATAIRANMKVWELADIDLCYHPAFGSAKDPINILGFIGENIFKGDIKIINVDTLKKKIKQKDKFRLVDVRTADEYDKGYIEGAELMPIDDFREASMIFGEDDEVVLYCASSYRSYLAYRILANRGFKNIWVLNGSYESWVRKI